METNNSLRWLGLASYEEKDASIFYGREKEIDELSGDIFHNTQTIIYGPSGTGKTSIIRAGIFSRARENNYFPVYIRLNHDGKEPYFLQIIQEIKNRAAAEKVEIENKIRYIEGECLSLWEFFHCNIFWNSADYPVIPLIVIDQFEELFTLAKEKDDVACFFEQLSDLCDDKFPQYIKKSLSTNTDRIQYPEKINYRCVLSLREDFLARLEECANTIPALKRNRYSLQAINEEQAMDIITKPSGGIVTREVAVEIIQKVTNRKDFQIDGIPEIVVEPALLSLFCNELDKKRIARGLSSISLELVREFGDNIIKDFYCSVVLQVSDSTVRYFESSLLTGDGFRDNVALKDALQKGVTKDELDYLQKNRLIRIEEWDGAKRIEFTHDVLCKVALECREKRDELRRLDVEREKNEALRRRNVVMYGLIAGLVAVICLIGWLYYNAYYAEQEAYYAQVIKRSGWFEGYRKLNREEASHLSCYYRLSKTGSATEHWTRLEAYDGYHKLTSDHSIRTPLLNQFDDDDEGANEQLKERLKTVCQWEMISDESGKMVTQERAYDLSGNLIYCYNPVWIGSNKVAGSYTDEYGLPIKLRKDGYNYLHITYDHRGFEVLYEFMDENGYLGKNKDGAYKTKKEYNDDGLQTLEASLNAVGNYMIDNFGNCGWACQYDKLGNPISFCYYDEAWKPIRVKGVNRSSSVIKKRWEYDRYGSIIEETYWTENDQPDVNQDSIHKISYDRNRYGQITAVSSFDLAGNLKGDSLGIASISREYDSYGHQTLFELKDSENRYVNNISGCAKNVTSYRGDTLVSDFEYRAQADSLYCYYSLVRTGNKTSIHWFDDNLCRIDSVNQYGNNVRMAYYQIDGSPTVYGGYHARVTDFDYRDSTTKVRRYYVDTRQQLTVPQDQQWASQYTVTDSLKKTKTVASYDRRNRLLSNYRQTLDSAFEHILTQETLNQFGRNARTGVDEICYYKTLVNSTVRGAFGNFIGCNEFGEPAYLSSSGLVYYFSYFDSEGNQHYCDEQGNAIGDTKEDRNAFIERLPTVIHCFIIDSAGYRLGLDDGDILIKYGDWAFSFDEAKNISQTNLYWEMISKTQESKEILVLRHDLELKSSRIVRLELPAGGPADLGFTTNVIHYTEKEKNRLTRTLDDYLKLNRPEGFTAENKQPGKRAFLIAAPYKKQIQNSTAFYKRNIQNPVLLLKVNGWDIRNGIDDAAESEITNSKKLREIVYLDGNMQIHTATFGYGVPMGFNCVDYTPTDEEYNRYIDRYKAWLAGRHNNKTAGLSADAMDEMNTFCPFNLLDDTSITVQSFRLSGKNHCVVSLKLNFVLDADEQNQLKNIQANINKMIAKTLFSSKLTVSTVFYDKNDRKVLE